MIAALLILTWGLAALAWYTPGVFIFVGRALCAFGEAAQGMRPQYKAARRPGPKAPKRAATLSPVQSDVVLALVSQGAPRGKAQAVVAALPTSMGFDDMFVQSLRRMTA